MAALGRRWYTPIAKWSMRRRRAEVRPLVFTFTAVLICILALVYAETVPQRTHLRVGYHAYVPFTMEGADGKPRGLAVEMINRAAKRAGIDLTWVPLRGNVDDALRLGQVDLLPMLTLTQARKEEFHASQPWWENETAIISRESDPIAGATSETSLATTTADRKIGIRGLQVLRHLAESLFPRAHLVIIPDMDALVNGLCAGTVDGIFLDVRLLQAQLMKGSPACAGQPLTTVSVPGGSLSQGTVARKEIVRAADRIYAEIAELALDGSLSEVASSWSMVGSFQNRHMKDIVDVQNREKILRWGLGILIIALAVVWFQNNRIRKARAVAVESRQRFDAFMNHTPALTFIRDALGNVVYVNNAVHKPFQMTPEELIRRLHPDTDRDLQLDQSAETTQIVHLADGRTLHFLCLNFPFANRGGEQFVGTVALDITERIRTQEELRFSQFSIEKSPDSIIWVDSAGMIIYANQAAGRMLGYPTSELVGLRASEIDDQRDWSVKPDRASLLRLASALGTKEPADLAEAECRPVEACYRRKGGDLVPVEVSLYNLTFGGRDFLCCIGRDITDRKKAESELAWQATHDALTGLPNRRCFESLLHRSLVNARTAGAGIGVFYFDLDGFKLINDTLGHAAGDELLKQLVRRLSHFLRDQDTLARMGGDEFTLIAPGVRDESSAHTVATRLLSGLQESFFVDGNELTVTASVGVSLFPSDGTDGATLLQHADAAMYEAKHRGKNQVQLFNPAMNEAVRERLEIENQLRRAVTRREFTLAYQPEFCLASGQVVRYEALLRWQNPVLGEVLPSKFIPVAEETGLIVPIGAWVLEEACTQSMRLGQQGSSAGVSVNVSGVQFGRTDFVDQVMEILARTGMSPRHLELELTETVIMHCITDAARKIARLRSEGVSVSIDDFGTGYSSLSYLQQLRIDNLKIDRSFIRDITSDPKALSLTNALVSLAHALNMKVIVEGVETSGQLEAAIKMGCDTAQGYYLGRPGPPFSASDGAARIEYSNSPRQEKAGGRKPPGTRISLEPEDEFSLTRPG